MNALITLIPMLITISLILVKPLVVSLLEKSRNLSTFTKVHLAPNWTTASIIAGIFVAIFIFLTREGFSAAIHLLIAPAEASFGSTYIYAGIFFTYTFIQLFDNSFHPLLERLTSANIKSGLGLFILILVTCALFSIDDYLAIIGGCLIVARLADTMGVSSTLIAAAVNVTAICLATLNPFSSWQPVINQNLSGGSEGLLHAVILCSVGGWIGLVLVFVLCCSGFSRYKHKEKQVSVKRYSTVKTNPDMVKSLMKVIVVLLSAHTINNFVLHLKYAFLYSMALTTAYMIAVTFRHHYLNHAGIIEVIKSAVSKTCDLCIYLFLLWTLSELIKNPALLNLTGSIADIHFDLPMQFVPAAAFLITSAFCIMIGSAYTAYSFLIPISIALTTGMPPAVSLLSLSAIVSGSVMSCFAVTSETMEMASKSMKVPQEDVREAQWHLIPRYVFINTIAFLLAGFYASFAAANVSYATLLLPLASGALAGFCLVLLSRFPSSFPKLRAMLREVPGRIMRFPGMVQRIPNAAGAVFIAYQKYALYRVLATARFISRYNRLDSAYHRLTHSRKYKHSPNPLTTYPTYYGLDFTLIRNKVQTRLVNVF